MPVFRYVAVEPASGAISRGEVTADSPFQVRVVLRRKGLEPKQIREPRSGISRAGSGLRQGRMRVALERVLRGRRRAILIELYESLGLLLATGTPLGEALDLAARSSRKPGSGRSILCRSLAESIRQGDHLEEALGRHPSWFGPIDIALIRAADARGEIDAACAELASIHGRSEELRGRLAMALAYPVLLSIFGLGVVVFLTTRTLPELAGVLLDADVTLPAATRLLLLLGTAITEWWPLAILAVLVITAAAAGLTSSPALARWRIRAPLVGDVLRRAQIGRASELISRLLHAGLPLAEAISLVTPTIPNQAVRQGFEDLKRGLEEGQDAGRHLSSQNVLDEQFSRIVEVGEESGELEPSLATFGARYQASARRLIDRLAALLEPAAILVLAAMVGFVVYAALMPMLRLTQTL